MGTHTLGRVQTGAVLWTSGGQPPGLDSRWAPRRRRLRTASLGGPGKRWADGQRRRHRAALQRQPVTPSQGASRQHATRGPPTQARGAANQPSPAGGRPARPGSSRRLTRRRWACFIHGPSSSARNQDTKSPAERGGATRPGTTRTA